MHVYVNQRDDRIIYFPQARKIIPSLKELNDFVLKMHKIKQKQWHRIMQEYIKDFDRLFNIFPKVPISLTLFRGEREEKGGDEKHKHKQKQLCSYLSTSLSKEIVHSFGIIREINMPKGANVIPIMFVSRYPVEYEILLPRNKNNNKKYS